MIHRLPLNDLGHLTSTFAKERAMFVIDFYLRSIFPFRFDQYSSFLRYITRFTMFKTPKEITFREIFTLIFKKQLVEGSS